MTAPSTLNPVLFDVATPTAELMIEGVFTRLSAQLGNKMADLYSGADPQDVKNEWGTGLTGFKPSEIKRGLKACQTRIFAPTLGEFLRLCRPALDPELAWLEAAEGVKARNAGAIGEWSHPAVYRAAVAMAFELASSGYKQCHKTWGWRLEREFAAGWGEPVPPPALRIECEPAKRAAPSAEQRQKIAELLAGRVAKTMPAAPSRSRPLTAQELTAAEAAAPAPAANYIDPAAALRTAEWAAANQGAAA